MGKSQVINELGNEVEHAYKICDDTKLKGLKILCRPRLGLKVSPRSGGKGPESIRKKKKINKK